MHQLTEAKRQEVKTPQSIVHIKHAITLRQYKIWLLLLQRYKLCLDNTVSPDEDGLYRFDKSELVEFLGYEPSKDVLRSELESLRKEPIIVNYLEKDGTPVMHGMGFISEWKVTTKAIRFKIPSFVQKVMQGLDQPKAIFQLINWQIFNHFTGKYEAVLYKLCRDYVGVGKTPYFTIEEFREYMGIKEGEHAEFKTLNKRVIDAPVEKINTSDLSDISVTTKFKTEGRKVLGVYFVVERRKQQVIPFVEFEENNAFRFAKVTIEPSKQVEYLALRSSDEIEACIERANEYGEDLAKKGKPVNYGAIYRSAINDGWHTQHVEKKAMEDEKKKIKESEKTIEEKKAERERIQKELDQVVWEKFLAIPEEKQDEIIREILIGKPLVLSQYEKKGKTAPIVKASIISNRKKHEHQ